MATAAPALSYSTDEVRDRLCPNAVGTFKLKGRAGIDNT